MDSSNDEETKERRYGNHQRENHKILVETNLNLLLNLNINVITPFPYSKDLLLVSTKYLTSQLDHIHLVHFIINIIFIIICE